MTKSIEEQNESLTSDVAWTKLLDGDADLTPSPTVIKMDNDVECPPLNDGEAQELTESSGRQRRESILATFNRQLQRSLKAVSESPGPLKRYILTIFF